MRGRSQKGQLFCHYHPLWEFLIQRVVKYSYRIFFSFLRLRSAVLVLGVVCSDDGNELRNLGAVGVSGYPSDPTLVSLWALCMNDQNSRVEK